MYYIFTNRFKMMFLPSLPTMIWVIYSFYFCSSMFIYWAIFYTFAYVKFIKVTLSLTQYTSVTLSIVKLFRFSRATHMLLSIPTAAIYLQYMTDLYIINWYIHCIPHFNNYELIQLSHITSNFCGFLVEAFGAYCPTVPAQCVLVPRDPPGVPPLLLELRCVSPLCPLSPPCSSALLFPPLPGFLLLSHFVSYMMGVYNQIRAVY